MKKADVAARLHCSRISGCYFAMLLVPLSAASVAFFFFFPSGFATSDFEPK